MADSDFNPDESADFGGTSPSTVLPTGTGAQAPVAGTPLSQQWTKLGIINEALFKTGNNTVTLPGDAETDEYLFASAAFDEWLGLTLYRRDWGFASQIAGLSRVGDSPWPGYADIFAKPADCLFFETCWRADLASLVQPAWFGRPSEQYDTLPPALDYQIFGDQVHTTVTPDFFGQPTGDFNDDFGDDFNTASMVYCKYIPFPTLKSAFSIGFMAALRLNVVAGLYRGLNEDSANAAWAEKAAEAALEEAANRSDQEVPRRVAFRSRLIEARRRGRYGGWCR